MKRQTLVIHLQRISSLSESEAATRGKRKCSRKFRKIHRKTPVPESLFQKIASLRLATLLKKRLWHRRFSLSFAKFSRTSCLKNTSGGCFCLNFRKILRGVLEPCQTSKIECFLRIIYSVLPLTIFKKPSMLDV